MGSESKMKYLMDLRLLATGALLAAVPASAAPQALKAPAKPKAAAVPQAAPLVSINVTPANAVLDGQKFRQQLLVNGVLKDGTTVDLTGKAKFASKTPKVAVVTPAGVVQPVGDGAAVISVSAGGKTTQASLTAKNIKAPFTWSFTNHVQ